MDTLDCVIIGYNEVDLQKTMAYLEKSKLVSGAFEQMRQSLIRFQDKWVTIVDFLNTILSEAVEKQYHLNTMELPNLGVCYLSSYLSHRNFSVEIINFYNREKEQLTDFLQNGPRSVAITTTSYVDDIPIREIIRFVRKHNNETVIILGGPHIFSICNTQDVITQDYLFNRMGADIYIVDSQGENTLTLVLHELKKGSKGKLDAIPNLIYRNNENVRASSSKSLFVRTDRKLEANDIDENVIDWSLFPNNFFAPTAQMRTSRGCAFNCSFCRFPFIGGPLTQTRIDTIEKEMMQLRNAGVKYLIFVDDTLNIPLPRFKKILKMMISNNFGFQWWSNFRCADADDETFELMKRSGCVAVFLGIESGDPQILENMNKRVSIERYKYGIHRLNALDIITEASFIIGFPGETKQTIQNTFDFIEEAQPHYFHKHIYFHGNDVPIQKEAQRFGLRGSQYSWRHDTMDWREAAEISKKMLKTIRGSIGLPHYMNNSRMLLYLLGKGLALDSIRKFLVLANTVFLENLDSDPAVVYTKEDNVYKELLLIGRKLSFELGSVAKT